MQAGFEHDSQSHRDNTYIYIFLNPGFSEFRTIECQLCNSEALEERLFGVQTSYDPEHFSESMSRTRCIIKVRFIVRDNDHKYNYNII